jgi:allantoinase
VTVPVVFRARRAVVRDDGTDSGLVERPVSVAVDDGRIVAIEPYSADIAADLVVETGEDEVLIPGLVDTHVHVNEPGRTEWEGFRSATRAAAAGGVTTIVDMPLNSVPATTDVHALEAKKEAAAGQCFVDVGFWGGAVPGNVTELRPLLEAGAYGVKCFLLDSGVPEFAPLSERELMEALSSLAPLQGLVLVHAEDPDAVRAAPECAGRSYTRFLESRPAEAEDAAVATVIEAARTTGGRAHIVHLSSATALPMIAAARADGVRLTVETCPHYLTLTAAEVPDGATAFKCCPPVRDNGNRDALWQGLADGVIDLVVSDHSPCSPELKRLDDGDFGAAWGGIASVQLGLALVWTEARQRGHSLADVVRWTCAAPAHQAGLLGKGQISEGFSADFAFVAPDEEFVVDPGRLLHRHAVSPYAGRILTGVARQTWLRGRPVDVDGEPFGELLSRGCR